MKSVLSMMMAFMFASMGISQAQAKKIDVNLDNLRTLESHLQFDRYQKAAGGVNRWLHLGGCEDGRANCLPLAGDGFYYQWPMYEPGEAILRREFSFNLPEEVK